MALDINKVIEAQNRLKKSQPLSDVSVRWWRPKDGKNKIRIVPPWTEEGPNANVVWREVAQHWNVSPDMKGPAVCPKNTPDLGDECPICDLIEYLKTQKDDPEALELVNKMRAKKTYFFNVVDLSDPVYTAHDVAEFKKNRPDSDVPFEAGDIKIQVYAAGVGVFNSIISMIVENNLDITDLDEGYDITIDKQGSGLTTKYNVTPNLRATKAPEALRSAKFPNLDKIGYTLSVEDAKRQLAAGPAADYATRFLNKQLPSATKAVASFASVDDDDDLPDSYGASARDDDSDDLMAELRNAIED